MKLMQTKEILILTQTQMTLIRLKVSMVNLNFSKLSLMWLKAEELLNFYSQND